jgi:hypothetical protein
MRVQLGVVCELVLVIAVIGTAVTLFPVIKRQNEGVALGYVAGRLLEAAIITVGIISVLSIVTLRQHAATSSADQGSLAAVAQALVAIHDWTFLLGPSVVLGLNSTLLAYLMYCARLVPRVIAVLGLIGGPLVTTSAVAVIFGLYNPAFHAVFALPVFTWEVSVAIYMIVKGFRPLSIAAASVPAPAPTAGLATA